MPHRFIQTATLAEMTIILNGGVIGGRDISRNQGLVHGLDTLTLIVNAAVITFVDVLQAGLPLVGAVSIKAAIEAGAPGGTVVTYLDGRLVVSNPAGVTIGAAGTANAIFGFGDTASVGTVYAAPSGVAPRVLGPVAPSPHGDSYFVHVETP